MGEVSLRSKRDHRSFALWVLMGLVAMAMVVQPGLSRAAETDENTDEGTNRILAIAYDQGTVHVSTEQPVEYRYRIYRAEGPLRVVVDFPGMTTADVPSPEFTADENLLGIRTLTQDSATGPMARVELLLARPADYNVVPEGKDFKIVVGSDAGEGQSGIGDTAAAEEAAGVAAVPKGSLDKAPASSLQIPAKKVVAVKAGESSVSLTTDGKIDKFRYFPLGAPPRLVVDIYGVTPDFAKRAFSLQSNFKKIRVGTYADKTRFVFDAASNQLPAYTVAADGAAVNITWDFQAPAKTATLATVSSNAKSGAPVTVSGVDFQTEKGRSILTVTLSGPAAVIEPAATGDVVRFGIKNANISRALRRAVDPSAFPSAIRLITPYTVLSGGTQDVRFAVELKGPVPYALEKEGNRLKFVVENGPFSDPVPAALETRQVPMTSGPESTLVSTSQAPKADAVVRPQAAGPVPMVSPAIAKEVYIGQKISLVFDDANIRNILQLIAEVSDLNIIAGDDVKGTITLRLVDVPWDQALDLIMDIKGLGMLREGNVVRILPKEQIRKMREEEFASARSLEKLEDLVTEVVTVNYSDIEDLAKRGKEYLSERGKIIEDVRNKNLIVTDIPSVVGSVKNLVALVDRPERQVLIEARIVEATSTFSRDLGVNWNLSYDNNPTGTSSIASETGGGGSFALVPAAVAAGFGGFASDFTFGRLGLDKLVLDLRLSALEQSGHGRIISTPRVTTLNGQEAEISQGTEIPYTTVSDEGTKIEFKKAELSLKVKPEINPDGSIFMEIEARNDARGAIVPTGVGTAVAIDTKSAATKMLVHDGETTVLGGIFIEDKSKSDSGIPWLKNIPIFGYLFKSTNASEERRELLIFITPRILE
jgi:type IV pilus assembly protein PilQ